MPTNYYAGRTEDELKEMLQALQNRASKGEVYMQGGSGTPQVVKGWTGAARVEVEIKRVLYALYKSGSVDFPDDPYAERIRRTRTRYAYS